MFDPQGNKWFGGGGVSEFNGTNWTDYDTANSGLVINGVRAIAIDAQGNKWFATSNGVSKFDGTHWTTHNPSNSGLYDKNAPFNDEVGSIAIDAHGNKWFAGPGISELRNSHKFLHPAFISIFSLATP